MDYFQEITHQAIILYEAKLVASLNPDTIPLNQAICTASPYFTNESKWLQLYEGLNSELKVKYSAHIYPEAKLGYATYLFHGLTETLLPTFRSFTAHRAKYVNVSLKGLSREQIEELGILVNVCDALYYWSAITIDTIKIFSPVEFKKYYDQIGEYIDLEELRPNPRPQPGRLVAPATSPPPASGKQKAQQKTTLVEWFATPGKYPLIMGLLVERGLCQLGTYLWIDRSAGAKTAVAMLIKYLHAQGFYTDNTVPPNKEIIIIAKQTFGVEMGIDTVKRAAILTSATHNFSFIRPASTY